MLALLAASLVCGVEAGVAAPDSAYEVELAVAGSSPVRLHVNEWGDGPPVLLVHGLGMSSYTWRLVAPELAKRYRVIAVDLKGFGRSDKPVDTAYSALDQAKLLAELVEQKHLDKVTLVGHSFGGVVALLTALELKSTPGRVARLVLIDAPALPQKFEDATVLVSAPLLPYGFLATTPPDFLVRMGLKHSRHPRRPPTDDEVTAYAAALHDAGGRHALIQTAQGILTNETKAWAKDYGRLDQPALLIWCRDDRIVPAATGRRLTRVLPNSRLTVLTGCNHIPQEERPTAVLSLLKPFLAR